MKRFLLVILLLFHSVISYGSEEVLRFGRFGTVHLYRDVQEPSHVVLFISGDGGWNLGVVDMAKELATLDALVVGIDITHYLKELETSSEKCSYPPGDFEALSKYVQRSLDFPSYITPVLIGYSSGATLAYATLVQAPPGTFAGAVSMGFCPDLPLSKPFCKGYGLEWKAGPKGKGYSFLPATNLLVPWVALQGTIDQVCSAALTESYVRQTAKAELVLLPKVGHGFSVPKNWMPQFRHAFTYLVQQRQMRYKAQQSPLALDVKDLPLIEVNSKEDHSSKFALIISGDGGWASLDRQIGETLAASGLPMVGLDSLQYFWTRRTPEGAANDLARVIRHYLVKWKKEKVTLIGYSFGADVLPFMVNRLPQDLQEKVELVALLGPSLATDFEFHLSDWLGNLSSRTARPLAPEMEKWKGPKILCFYGEEEKESLCNSLKHDLLVPVRMSGGHHFGGDYEDIAKRILNETH